MTHEVWGIPFGAEKPKLYESFEEADWEWALKLARRLRKSGVSEVHIVNKDDNDESV